MSLALRTHQIQGVIGIIVAFLRHHRAVLYVLPTGGGKSYIFSYIAERLASKGGRVLIIVHRHELLRQACDTLRSNGVHHGIISRTQEMDLSENIQVASVQTLVRRLYRFDPSLFHLLVIDEAHHTNAGTWVKVLEYFKNARVLGVTATPCRSDGRGLGEFYSEMVLGPTSLELTASGLLAPAKVICLYDCNRDAVSTDYLVHYRRELNGLTAIVFCCTVSHAEAVADMFKCNGVSAASIDGTMHETTRERLLDDLGAGRIKVLTSCALIGEGVDVPSVGGCILLRPTQSVSLHLQMIGRCLRPQEGKTAIVLDFVGNYDRLGHHLLEREWTLDG